MEPALHNGDIVIARNLKPKLSDIVIARIDGREVIKRITKIKQNSMHLSGDNLAHSTDSRNYGMINSSNITGVVVRIWKKSHSSNANN